VGGKNGPKEGRVLVYATPAAPRGPEAVESKGKASTKKSAEVFPVLRESRTNAGVKIWINVFNDCCGS